MTETWKRYCEGVYISNKGNLVKDYDGNKFIPRIVNHKPTKKGYIRTKINGKSYRLHRLVAGLFLTNPNDYPTIDHINREKTDNRVINLRWANYSTQAFNRKQKILTKPQSNNKLNELYISKNKNRFWVRIYRRNIKKSFKSLKEAIKYRNQFVSDIP